MRKISDIAWQPSSDVLSDNLHPWFHTILVTVKKMWCRHQCLRWLNLEVNKEVFMISATLFNNDSPLSRIWRWIIYYYCFSTYHTSSKESAKNYFICDNKLNNDWFLEVCALLHAQRWRYLYIITSELANMCQKHYSLVW